MQYNLEDLLKRIDDLRDELEKLKTHDNENHVKFIDTVLDWLEDLFRVRRWERIRLALPQWKDIEPLLFPNTLEILKTGETPLYALFDEAPKLLNKIVEIGNISIVDFDLLQFNLARIFGKDVDVIIEHVRHNLGMKLAKLRLEELRKKEEEEKIREAEKWKILSMSERELRRFVVSQMFEFTPSARTEEERREALRRNREKAAIQKEKFRNFAGKLHKATTHARAGAQMRARLGAEDVKNRMLTVTEEFREKAREFVSEEGFRSKVDDSRKMMFRRRDELHKIIADERKLVKAKGVGWKELFGRETDEARKVMLRKRKELQLHEDLQKQQIKSKGEEEISRATGMMLGGKKRFSDGVEHARGLFTGRSEEIEEAREDISKARIEFAEKKKGAKERFDTRATEVEDLMSLAMYRGRENFETARGEVRQKFLQRAQEVKATGLRTIGKMEEGMGKFHGKGEQFKAKSGELKYKAAPTEEITSVTKRKEEQIKKESCTMMEQAKTAREDMRRKIKHSKELFELDIRFAQHKLKNASKVFREKAEDKNEEFKSRQHTLLARHKARQKAHLVRNLLRVIRSVK